MKVNEDMFDLARFCGPMEVVVSVSAAVAGRQGVQFVKKAAVLFASAAGIKCCATDNDRIALSGPGVLATPGPGLRRLIVTWLMSLDQVALITLRAGRGDPAFVVRFECI